MQNTKPTTSTLHAWQPKEPVSKIFSEAGFEIASVIDFSCLDERNANLTHLETVSTEPDDYPKGKSTPPNWLLSDAQALENWLNKSGHASMHFMQENKAARADPRLVLADLKSAIVFLVPYSRGQRIRGTLGSKLSSKAGSKNNAVIDSHKKTNIEKNLNNRDIKSNISQATYDEAKNPYFYKVTARYAQGKDYHKVIKARLNPAARKFKESLEFQGHGPISFRITVDSVPLFERAFAREAGLGFVGKSTMFIRPGLGTYFFICTLLLNTACSNFANNVKHNAVSKLDCGMCNLCIEACPTQALSPYFLDSHKCLSYLSIENRNIIPNEYLKSFVSTAYGCDICQDVCPYNFTTGFVEIFDEILSGPLQKNNVTVTDVAKMTKKQYEAWFGGTALTRAKYAGLVRNALVHLYAINSPHLGNILLDREHDSEELISQTAKQLLKKLKNTIS